jgi:hypothetical protein
VFISSHTLGIFLLRTHNGYLMKIPHHIFSQILMGMRMWKGCPNPPL